MENPNQNDDNNINVNLDEIIEESNNKTIETNEIDAIELRIQELEILIDQKEQEYFASLHANQLVHQCIAFAFEQYHYVALFSLMTFHLVTVAHFHHSFSIFNLL